MKFPSHRLLRFAAPVVLAGGLVLIATAGPASATSCTSPVRYAASSNTIYLVAPQQFTLTDVKKACAAAPLTLVDAATKTWELSADLVVQNGATLDVHGGTTGDANTLRLRSLADNLDTHVSAITAQYGVLSFDSTHVTSWDDAAAAPDTHPALPTGAPSTDRGRAFIRALSYLDGATPRQSKMYINHSELDHLGYYGAEAYGVAYKTRGCDHTAANYPVCQQVNVGGRETNSHFHDNFMGTYTWGAKSITFSGNEYDHNVMYGLDPHDVSTYLTIDHNHFDYNGDHGVICSQRCDHLKITNNESDHNGMVPFTGPTGDADTAGQVHGIMIHRGVTNTVISGNYVHDEPNGAGIAVFDSAGDTITNNTIVRAEYGIRLSVGSANNTVTGNTITNSTQYGLFLYKGSDPVSYTTANGHPSGNVFSNDTVNGTGSNAVKFSEADHNRISTSTFSNTGGSLLFQNSTGTVLTDATLSSSQRISVSGTSTEPGFLRITDPRGPIMVSVDSRSSYDVTGTKGQLFTVTGGKTTIKSTGSYLHLTSAILGTTGYVTITPSLVAAVPAKGTGHAAVTGAGRSIRVRVSGIVAKVHFSIGGLAHVRAYAIKRDGTVIAVATTNRHGVLRFWATPTTIRTHTYTVARH